MRHSVLSLAVALWSVAIAAPAFAKASEGRQGELIERALAIVGGQVISLSEVRTMLALGLVDGKGDQDPLTVATSKLIDRALMLREVDRYAPSEPAAEMIDARLAVVHQTAGSPEAFNALLAAGGMSEPRLREWIRNDYRITNYLEQRFAAAGTPTDQEVSAYYNDHLDEFQRGGLSFEQAGRLIRDRLAGERRRELITDWVLDLRRRTEIIHVKQ